MNKPLETTAIDGYAKPANVPPRTQVKPDERLPIKERQEVLGSTPV